MWVIIFLNASFTQGKIGLRKKKSSYFNIPIAPFKTNFISKLYLIYTLLVIGITLTSLVSLSDNHNIFLKQQLYGMCVLYL